jgi:hypothetical protein
MKCSRTARGFGCGSGMASVAARERVPAHTNPSALTRGNMRGIVSKSTGGGRRDTRLLKFLFGSFSSHALGDDRTERRQLVEMQPAF